VVISRWDGLTDEQRADEIERRRMTDDLETLYQRSEAGIRWLTEHDETGAFHLWYTSRIAPGTPMPAQPPEVQSAYREYHEARELWERIESRIKTVERQQGAAK
jgi:hypothetical protein